MNNSNVLKLLSNYGSRLWSLISVFIFVPLYIRYLGIENYAVIGFYSLLLGIISFADAGMSSAIIKEFAKDQSASYKYSLLRKIETLYLSICVIIALMVFLFSHYIALNWLKTEKIPIDDLSYYISLVGFGVVLQLLSSLYFGAFFGLNQQVKANLFQITWNVLKSGFVILLLIYYKPTLEVYFVWQIIINLIYIFVLRFSTIRCLKSIENKLQNYLKEIPKSVLEYIGGMVVIAIISSINSQADKLITSSFFSLKTFGYYNIASILAQVPVILATPLAMFVFPFFSKFSEIKNRNQLNITYKKASFLLNIILFPATIILFLYMQDFLLFWTGKSIEAKFVPVIVQVAKTLLIGSFFLALQFPLYYLLLSKGKTKYNIYQGIVQIAFALPLLYFVQNFTESSQLVFHGY